MNDNILSIDDKKDILLLNLLYEFCKNKKYGKSFEYLSYQLYSSGYISDRIFGNNNLSSELSKLYLNDEGPNILSLITQPNEILINNMSKLSTLSRFKSQFSDIEYIGSGGFGSVYKVKNLIDDSNYAIKILSMNMIQEYYLILREVRILSKLKHENVIGYYSSWIGVDDINETEEYEESDSFLKLYIQMELCDSTLDKYLSSRKHVEEFTNTNFIDQICDGLEYLHNNNIVHRDIKPKNIFLNENIVKIGDFGLSRKIIKGDRVLVSNINNVYTSNIGSLLYSAPELLEGGIYNEKVDIYSLGIIIFELFSLFTTEMEKSKECEKLKGNNEYNFQYQNVMKIITKSINSDPTKRSTLNEIRNMEI
jgi:serine/threonine protein kinase